MTDAFIKYQMTAVAHQKDLFTKRWRRVNARDPSELQIQISLIARLRLQARRNCIYFHIPNGELRDKRTAAKLKAMGVMPGAADLCFIWRSGFGGEGFHFPNVLFLELKARGRKLTAEQLQFRARTFITGAFFETADNIDDAVKILTDYGILP